MTILLGSSSESGSYLTISSVGLFGSRFERRSTARGLEIMPACAAIAMDVVGWSPRRVNQESSIDVSRCHNNALTSNNEEPNSSATAHPNCLDDIRL